MAAGRERGRTGEEMKERNKGKRKTGYLSDYVVFDLETTGINPATDAIIEISAVKVRGHQAQEEYSTLVNPGRHIPAGATAVNGITDEMVQEAPTLREALPGFLAFVGEMPLVGHNIHTFDTNFIYDAVWEVCGREFGNDYVDTLYMARHCLPELSHHRLTDVAAHFQIETGGAHRALADCVMNQKCYEELGRMMEEEKNREPELVCPKCGGMLIRRKGKFGEFYGCGAFPGCRYTRNIQRAL